MQIFSKYPQALRLNEILNTYVKIIHQSMEIRRNPYIHVFGYILALRKQTKTPLKKIQPLKERKTKVERENKQILVKPGLLFLNFLLQAFLLKRCVPEGVSTQKRASPPPQKLIYNALERSFYGPPSNLGSIDQIIRNFGVGAQHLHNCVEFPRSYVTICCPWALWYAAVWSSTQLRLLYFYILTS